MSPWTVLRGAASLAAPSRCLSCAAPLDPQLQPAGWEGALCHACRGELRWVGEGCPRCGRPSPCRCRSQSPLASTTALLRYRGVARRLLHALKYGGHEQLGPALGQALARRLLRARPAGIPLSELLVVPVPLHPWRRWRRGFNQAEELVSGVAALLERPAEPALRRTRRTPPLYGVPTRERALLLAGCFQARPGLVQGRAVLLVDDIRTSGATLAAAGGALQAAGATRVDGLVVAA